VVDDIRPVHNPPIEADLPAAHRNLSMVFQNLALFPLALMLRLQKASPIHHRYAS